MSDTARAVGTFWVFNLDWPLPAGAQPAGATFARISGQTAHALARVLVDPAVQAEALLRLKGDHRCYAIMIEGQVAAYGWVSYNQAFIGELGLRLDFEPGEAYIWDCATLPAYRRRGYYTALLVHMLGELRADGLCRVWIGADSDNAASLRGMASAGFVWISELCIDDSGARTIRGRPGAPDALVATTRRLLLGE